jgi:hypothetical protein
MSGDMTHEMRHTPVKRYNGWELAEQSDGPLVEYSDYKALQQQRDELVKALEQIRDTPHSMVNDSESLRHTLKLIDAIACAAITKAEAP